MRRGMILLLCLVFLSALFIPGCGGESGSSAYAIFYVNKEGTKLYPQPYAPQSGGADLNVGDLIVKLQETPDNIECKKPLPSGVELLNWELNKAQLTLNFNADYLTMNAAEEILCRAAFVYTLTQAQSVDGVFFFVSGQPLMDRKDTPIGLMTAESFVENPGEEVGTVQEAQLVLYFSNKQGTGLVKTVEDVHYGKNLSMEKLVLERLMAGPETEDAIATIPAGTKLLKVQVLGNVCFVNFDSGFLTQNNNIDVGVVIYSVVNSLAELPNVNKVQISVEGDSKITYGEKFSLETPYGRDLDYLAH